MAIIVNARYTNTGVSVRGPDGRTTGTKVYGKAGPEHIEAAVVWYAAKSFINYKAGATPVTAVDAGPGVGFWFVIG